MYKVKRTLCAGVAAILATTGAVMAQDSPDEESSVAQMVTESGAIVGYAPGFFIAYSPVTALDMVRRIPGFSLSGGNTNRRGLGDSFGNLLINGDRPSNKSVSLDTVLQRIPASDVERVELVREAHSDFDMRGHARLVNVILREGAGNSGSYSIRLTHWDSGRLTPDGEISYSTHLGDVELNFGLEATLRGPRQGRRETLRDSTGTLIEQRLESDQRRYWEYEPTFAFNAPLGENTSLRFDSRAWIWEWRRGQISNVSAPNANGDLMPSRLDRSSTTNFGHGLTGTFTFSHEFSDSVSMETVFLATREQWEDGPEAFETYDPVAFVNSATFTSDGEREETALRQTFSWTVNPQHSLEVGAEAAFNARDSSFNLTFIPFATPVTDNTRVEESRAELFATHVWTINDALSLESGFRFEFSEIAQSGDAVQERSFSYPKPSVTLNWRADEQTRWRFSVRRDVDQLQFGKFASSVNVSDNNTVLGNPNYVPQRTWTAEAEWERRFGDEGSLSVRVGYDYVEDLDDFISITTPTGVFDAPGNIGNGTNLRVTTELSTPLDAIGLENAVLTSFLEWYNTNVTDPLTGQDRNWSGTREWEVRLDFRQNFPEQQIAWGWDYFWLSDGDVYRSQELRHEGFTDGDLDIYVETTRWFGVTTRLGVDGIIDNGQDRERIFYNGSRALGNVSAIENQNSNEGPRAYLQLRGTF